MTNVHHHPTYKRHRYPQEVIAHAVWLYYGFCLSYRDVEDLFAERGIVVSYETIRKWCRKFGHACARRLRQRRAQPGDVWHVDELFIKIRGKTHYLYRAVDQHGAILEIQVQKRRNKAAAIRFFRTLLRRCQYTPRILITDKLRSYPAAQRVVFNAVEHQTNKRLNNRVENSHRHTRRRERFLYRFRTPQSAQRFLSVHDLVQDHFRPKRHLLTATIYRDERRRRFEQWYDVTALAA
jgi:putative transposase